jgi:hypothetical protein
MFFACSMGMTQKKIIHQWERTIAETRNAGSWEVLVGGIGRFILYVYIYIILYIIYKYIHSMYGYVSACPLTLQHGVPPCSPILCWQSSGSLIFRIPWNLPWLQKCWWCNSRQSSSWWTSQVWSIFWGRFVVSIGI